MNITSKNKKSTWLHEPTNWVIKALNNLRTCARMQTYNWANKLFHLFITPINTKLANIWPIELESHNLRELEVFWVFGLLISAGKRLQLFNPIHCRFATAISWKLYPVLHETTFHDIRSSWKTLFFMSLYKNYIFYRMKFMIVILKFKQYMLIHMHDRSKMNPYSEDDIYVYRSY